MAYFFNFDKLTYVRGEKPSGCILCLLRDGSPEVTDLTVYQDELVQVTVNLYPYNPGHVMVFPRRHVLDIRELTREEEARTWDITRRTLDILDEQNSASGYNVGYNMGRVAGASVEHLHLHLIPRYPNELGIADLMGGKRVLVEDPRDTQTRLKRAFDARG